MKDIKGINEKEKFEEIPIEDFPSNFDESYLDNIIEKKSTKEKDDDKQSKK